MFVRVRDKATRHQYDVAESAFDPEKHERLNRKDYPPSRTARPAKPHIKKLTAPRRDRPGPSRFGGRPSAKNNEKE